MLDIPMLQPAPKTARTEGDQKSAKLADKTVDDGSQDDFDSAYAAEENTVEPAATQKDVSREEPDQPETENPAATRKMRDSAETNADADPQEVAGLDDSGQLKVSYDTSEQEESQAQLPTKDNAKKSVLSAAELAITQGAEKVMKDRTIVSENAGVGPNPVPQTDGKIAIGEAQKMEPRFAIKAGDKTVASPPQAKSETPLTRGVSDRGKGNEVTSQVKTEQSGKTAGQASIAVQNNGTPDKIVPPGSVVSTAVAELTPRANREKKSRDFAPTDTSHQPPKSYFEKPRSVAQTIPTVQQHTFTQLSRSTTVVESLELQPLTSSTSEVSTQWDPRSAGTNLANPVFARAETASLVGRQMAEALQKLPDKPVELALNPKELGRVKMSIASVEGAITVTVLAERPETLDLMRRHIDQLAREFQAIGYESINFAFSEGQSNENANSESRQDQNSQSTDPGALEATEAAPTPIQLTPSSGVDIRL